MTWFCCCRGRDNTETCSKSDSDEKPAKAELRKRVAFTGSSKSESEESGSKASTYENVRKYDERQIQSQIKKHLEEERLKNVHLAEKVYYPPTQRRNSRIPLEQQRAEANRLQSVGTEPPRHDRRPSLLETSREAGKTLQWESMQKQQLYKVLTQK